MLSYLLFWDEASHWPWLAGQLLESVFPLTPPLRPVLGLQVCVAVSVYQVSVGDPDSGFPACVILCPVSRLLSPFCFIFISMIYVEFFKYVPGFMCFTHPVLISFIRKTNFVSLCCYGSFVKGLLTVHVTVFWDSVLLDLFFCQLLYWTWQPWSLCLESVYWYP